MQFEWLSDDDTPLDVQEYEVGRTIDAMTIDERLADGFALLGMN